MEQTLDFEELSSALALKALATMESEEITITGQPNAGRPETLRALKWLGDELAKAYLQGVTDGREGTPFADFDEAHEHEVARLNSATEKMPSRGR